MRNFTLGLVVALAAKAASCVWIDLLGEGLATANGAQKETF